MATGFPPKTARSQKMMRTRSQTMMRSRPISRLRKVKRDLTVRFSLDSAQELTTLFDSGWVPGKGDPSRLFRNVQIQNPIHPEWMVMIELADDGSAKVNGVKRR